MKKKAENYTRKIVNMPQVFENILYTKYGVLMTLRKMAFDISNFYF